MEMENTKVKEEIEFLDIKVKEEPRDEVLQEENINTYNHQGLVKKEIKTEENQNDEDPKKNTGNVYAKRNYSSDDESSQSTSESENKDKEDNHTKCKVCQESFETEDELESHKQLPMYQKDYKCCACTKTFKDFTQLSVHHRKHTGEKPYGCKICGKKFSINGNLNKHIRTHTGEKRFECDTCERKFTQFAHLEDHIKTHTGDRPFGCDKCSRAFVTKSRLRKHLQSHDVLQKKYSIKCEVCFCVLRSTRMLASHMKIHTNDDEPFTCSVCKKRFKGYWYLQHHLKTHSGIKAFSCEVCEKKFVSSSHLRRHMNSHSGFKPFVCELCMRGFPCAQNLKRHMKTHTGEKPHVCGTCEKAFLTLENLNRHIRTHTKEKPYPCTVCGRCFAHSTTAKEHMHLHTGEKPFGCSLCNKRFGLNKMLYRHIRTRHPESTECFKTGGSALQFLPIDGMSENMQTPQINENLELYKSTDLVQNPFGREYTELQDNKNNIPKIPLNNEVHELTESTSNALNIPLHEANKSHLLNETQNVQVPYIKQDIETCESSSDLPETSFKNAHLYRNPCSVEGPQIPFVEVKSEVLEDY